MRQLFYSFLLSLHLIYPMQIIKEGDLLFQDLDCGPICSAIESATTGYHNYKISHVGFVVKMDNKKYVLEAYKKVELTPLKEFLFRSCDSKGNPKVIVERLNHKYLRLIPKAKKYGLLQIDKPYDKSFKLNNGAYYCCELIYDMFSYANKSEFFHLYPMNFKNLNTGKIPDVWTKYFREMNMNIPQGEPGCNPAKYSKNKYLKVVAILGKMEKNN